MSSNPTIDAYNKYAGVYDREVIDFWAHFPPLFVKKFAASLLGKRVLSLGSGSGRDALLLREHGLEVVCIDASEAMVEMTQGLGFESHVASFSDASFPDASFDGIWAYTSLIHIPKNEAAKVIARAHTWLKPKGSFVMGAIQGNTAGMVERKTMPGVTRYFKNYTPAELQTLVEPAGFALVHGQSYQPHSSVYINQLYKKV